MTQAFVVWRDCAQRASVQTQLMGLLEMHHASQQSEHASMGYQRERWRASVLRAAVHRLMRTLLTQAWAVWKRDL